MPPFLLCDGGQRIEMAVSPKVLSNPYYDPMGR